MAQSFFSVYVHAVFSTKLRQPWLRDAKLRMETHSYLAEVSNQLNYRALVVGGVEDHVHVLAQMDRETPWLTWIKELKRVSSVWMKKRNPDFSWQRGYGAFSVSYSALVEVSKYIQTQEAHHRKYSFQEEFRRMLERHHMEWDERYVWD